MTDPSLQEIAAIVENPKIAPGPDGEPVLRCGCPAHGGEDRNCAIKYGSDGKLLAHCHSHHCDFQAIITPISERLGRSTDAGVKITVGSKAARALEATSPPKIKGSTTTWELKDANGNLVALHVRKDTDAGKTVKWRLPGGEWNLGGRSTNDLPLYGAEIIARAPVNVPVVVSEGEKAADALRAAGVMGVGTVTGSSGTPCAESLEVLRGRKVILWPDNDESGFSHMGRVAEGLSDVAAELLWYEWPEAPDKGDAADHPSIDVTELEAAPRWSKSPAIEGRVLLGRAIENGIDPPTELLPDILLAGKAHNIFAPGGVGKTWVLVWIATELVKRGKKVVVFDLENGFRTYAERFEEIGGDPEELDKFLHYYPFPVFDRDSYGRMLDELQPDLVMFDSWIGFLAADGRDENESNDISAWADAYSKPALKRGTAIVVLDHVPHEHDDRERGSRRKRDEMDVAWRLAKIVDFDRERIGLLSMTRVKDREGWLPERLTFEIGGDPDTGRFIMQRNDEFATVQIVHLNDRERLALEALEMFGSRGATTQEWLAKIAEVSNEIEHKQALHHVRRSLVKKEKVIEDRSRYIAKSTLHVGGIESVDEVLTSLCQYPSPGGVDGVDPLKGVSTHRQHPPTESIGPDVGGFGSTEEERKEKYEQARLKRLRERDQEEF